MRHSRRAVMAERYKLYMKKNVLNGKYFVRNLQIVIVLALVSAMVFGGILLVNSDAGEKVTNTKVSVKDALFGNSEESKVVAKNTEETTENVTEEVTETSENTEVASVTEQVQDDLNDAVTEAMEDANAATVEKEEKEEPKSEFDNKCIANVEDTLNIRNNPSTDGEFVGSMNPGAIATVLGTEGEWTKIKSGDVEGYVLTEYVLTGASAEELAEDYVTLRGTVLEDGVNIRSEKSTEAEILVVLDKDATITVLENEEEKIEESEATEDSETNTEEITVNAMAQGTEEEQEATEIEWLPVMLEDGQTGYVSADLVEVDELYEIAVSAEELERQAAAEAEAKRLAEEEAARQAAEEAARQAASTQTNNNNNSTSNNTTSSNNSTESTGATTKPVTTTEAGECIGTFTITAYCGCKKCSGGNSKTASGTTPTEGRTIAADTSVLPFGTQVVIGGVVYTVEDCGSGVSGNHIDIFFATHSKALAFGRKTMKVYKY